MNENNLEAPWVDGALFNENVKRLPSEDIRRYAGKKVAWDLDGTRFLASGRDYEELKGNLEKAGVNPTSVVWGYIPSDDEHAVLL